MFKTHVCLCKLILVLHRISHTTRKRRPDEQDGVDYHFVPLEKFESDIRMVNYYFYPSATTIYIRVYLNQVVPLYDNTTLESLCKILRLIFFVKCVIANYVHSKNIMSIA